MFGFEYPEAFFAAPFIAYCFFRCKEMTQSRYFVHLHFFSIRKGGIDWRYWLKLLAALSMLAALASPVTVNPFDPKNRQGIAMMLSMDASGSMIGVGFDEQHIQKTKFEAVKEVVQEFISRRINDNIGVVLFGDFAFIATPLTYEKEALSQMVEYLTLGMAGENTALGEGIYQSLAALEAHDAKNKIIVLLTDGMHNAGQISPESAVREAKKLGVKIYTIGIGAQNSFDVPILTRIAQESGGTFFHAPTKAALEGVYEQIDTLERSQLRSRDYLSKTYWYEIPLVVALLFIALLVWKRGVV